MLVPKLVDSVSAPLLDFPIAIAIVHIVVVDDHPAPGRDVAVQPSQRQQRRLIQVAIKAQQRNWLRRSVLGQCLLKYPLHEMDVAVVVDAIACKGAAHALERRGVVVGALTNETHWRVWHANKAFGVKEFQSSSLLDVNVWLLVL